MRPFSSPSDKLFPSEARTPGGLFDEILARGNVRDAVSDEAWLAALIAVEAALAQAEATAGVIPVRAAEAIIAACARLSVDVRMLSVEAAASGTPVLGLVNWLRAAVPPDLAQYVHKGATSQDIMDSAAMLVAREATTTLVMQVYLASEAAASNADAYRDTPMVGRTLLRQAVPTTFGLKAAGWMTGLLDANRRLGEVRDHRLAVQFGGAAGTLAGLDGKGPEVAALLAQHLGLVTTVLPWHTNRSRVVELAAALGQVCGAVAKVARDVILLSQDEVAEVSEGTPGVSSAMAHKRNPVAAISAAAAAAQAPGLVATLFAAMAHEHERAAGSWHAEWRPMRELFICTGSAAIWLTDCLQNLEVDPDAMAANLQPLLAQLGTTEPDLGSAVSMVDRALAARR